MLPRPLILMCGFILAALAATPAAADKKVVVGVNVVSPQRLNTAAREALLEQLQAAGVRMIRTPLAPPWGGEDYGPAVDFIRRAYERGIKADLIVGLQYPEGAQRRPAVKELPKMWSSYPLSSADPGRFRTVFGPLFNQIEDLGITLAALELGNEINWTAFNGDFPIPGGGKVFGLEDLTRDPEARRIADGYHAYLQTLTVQLEHDTLAECRSPGQGKPCWLTEWGLPTGGPACPTRDTLRAALTRELLGHFRQFVRDGGLNGLIYYAWSDEKYGIYRCHALTESGRLVLDPKGVE